MSSRVRSARFSAQPQVGQGSRTWTMPWEGARAQRICSSPFERGEEAEPVGGIGLLLGVGVDFVVDARGVGEAVEEGAVVLAD